MSTLSQVVAELQNNNDELREVSQGIKDLVSTDLEAAKLAKIEAADALAERRKSKFQMASKGSSPKGFVSGIKAGAMEASGGDFMMRLLGGIFGGATVATLLGTFGKFLGKGIVFIGIAKLFENFAGDITKGAISLLNKALPESWQKWLDDDANQKKVTDEMVSGVNWGLIGWAFFGARFGAIFFAGSLLSSWLKNTLVKNNVIKEDGTVTSDFINNKLGTNFNIPDGTWVEVGGVIGSVLGLMLGAKVLGGLLRAALFTGAAGAGGPAGRAASRTLRPGIFKFLKSGFMKRFGLGIAITALGTGLAMAIEAWTGDPELGSIIGNAFSITALFAIGGPLSLVVGAVAGIAFAIAALTAKWFDDRRDKLISEARARAFEMEKEYNAAFLAGDYEEAARIAEMQANSLRQGERPEDFRIAAAFLKQKIKRFEEANDPVGEGKSLDELRRLLENVEANSRMIDSTVLNNQREGVDFRKILADSIAGGDTVSQFFAMAKENAGLMDSEAGFEALRTSIYQSLSGAGAGFDQRNAAHVNFVDQLALGLSSGRYQSVGEMMNDPNFKANLADINNLDGFHAKIVAQGPRRKSKLVEFDQLLDDDKRKIVINNIYGNAGELGPAGGARAPAILTLGSEDTSARDPHHRPMGFSRSSLATQ